MFSCERFDIENESLSRNEQRSEIVLVFSSDDAVTTKDATNPGTQMCLAYGQPRIPATAIILPVTPFSPRWKKNKPGRQRVHRPRSEMFLGDSPAAISWRRLAAARSRKIFFGNSLWPGARDVRNNNGYFS